MEEIPTYLSCKWPFPTSPWQEGWSCCQGSEIRCANQDVRFSVPQNLEDATLQRNYGQLPRDTVSFSFIIARDKFSRYYRDHQPPPRCQGQNYQHFCPNRTQGVCEDDRAMTNTNWRLLHEQLLSKELPSLKWLYGLQTLPPVKRALPVSPNVCKSVTSSQWKKRCFTKNCKRPSHLKTRPTGHNSSSAM